MVEKLLLLRFVYLLIKSSVAHCVTARSYVRYYKWRSEVAEVWQTVFLHISAFYYYTQSVFLHWNRWCRACRSDSGGLLRVNSALLVIRGTNCTLQYPSNWKCTPTLLNHHHRHPNKGGLHVFMLLSWLYSCRVIGWLHVCSIQAVDPVHLTRWPVSDYVCKRFWNVYLINTTVRKSDKLYFT